MKVKRNPELQIYIYIEREKSESSSESEEDQKRAKGTRTVEVYDLQSDKIWKGRVEFMIKIKI